VFVSGKTSKSSLIGIVSKAVGCTTGSLLVNIRPGVNVKKFFTNVRNKLECLSLAGISSLV
jgi:hypothetical protein